MKQTELPCFQGFQCLADVCPDTCCAGWTIDLDEEILQVYEKMSGSLGAEIRQRIAIEDGVSCFSCIDGRCPFLDGQKLCRLIRAAQGEQTLLSEVCREHPRFHEEYGVLRETCFAISCPEAARLLLEAESVFPETREIDGPEEPENAPEPWLFALLCRGREALLSLIRNSAGPMDRLLSAVLLQGWSLQAAVDNGISAEAYDPAAVTAGDMELQPELSHWLAVLQQMEFTDDRLPKLLKRVSERAVDGAIYSVCADGHRQKLQNLLVYFLYRYLLRGVWDEDVLGKVMLAIRSVETIALLAEVIELPAEAALMEAAVRYGREVEHSDENLELLYDAAWRELFPETDAV